MWQNDGTERNGKQAIKPARFVEKAIRAHNSWQNLLFRTVSKYLFEKANLQGSLMAAGRKIGIHINEKVNRIDTGRLRISFTARTIFR
jgi:hypothetical protein